MEEFNRRCPTCDKELFYSNKGKLTRAIKDKCKCRSCSTLGRIVSTETAAKISVAHKGRISPLRGRPISEEHKRKDSIAHLGKRHSPQSRLKNSFSHRGCKAWNKGKNYSEERKKEMSECAKQAMHRPEVRRRHIEALYDSEWLKVKTDKGQLEMLEKWRRLGFHFKPNYAVKGDDFLYYLDGYDPVLNVVMEYDGKYHFRKSTEIQMKDRIREKNIINLLHPRKFWRYNAVEKTWKSV